MRSSTIFFTVLGLVSSFFTFGQQRLASSIVDADSGKPVPYANVSVANSGIGTASDESGSFQLQVPQGIRGGRINISCIGYINRSLSIDSLLGLQEKPTVKLKPATEYLNEVVVKGKQVTPKELLDQVVESIPKNYSQQPFNITFYSKISLFDDNKKIYTVESVISTYRDGYVPGALNASKILQKRETGVNPFANTGGKDSEDYFPYSPVFDVFLPDQIGVGSGNIHSVFNPELLKKLKLELDDVSSFDKDTVCVIRYDPSKEKYTGIIYATSNSLAVVKHVIKIGNKNYEIYYKKFNGLYYPYLIRAESIMGTKKASYKVLNEIVLIEVKKPAVDVFKLDISKTDLSKVKYDAEYWKVNFPEK